MDVHYSLPREIDLKKRCDRDRSQVSTFYLFYLSFRLLNPFYQNQGTLSLRIPNSTASIDDAEVRARFGTCGDINSILPDPKHPADRLVEFWDCRVSKFTLGWKVVLLIDELFDCPLRVVEKLMMN